MAKRKTRKRPGNDRGTLDSFLFKSSTKLILSFVVIVIFLTLAQCTVKKPESPEWNSTLTVPLINRTYPLEEIISKIDQDGIEMDTAGNITYSFSKELDTVAYEQENLATGDIAYSLSQTIGTVDISPPGSHENSVSMAAAMGGLVTEYPGDSVLVPDTSFSIITDMPLVTTYNSATVSNGQALVIIENALGIALDTVIISLVDKTYGLIAQDTFPSSIPNGDTDSLSIQLSGDIITSHLEVQSYIRVPQGVVIAPSTRYIYTKLDFPDPITVSAAEAQIPSLIRTFNEEIALGESDRIDTAVLSSGNFSLSITNSTNLDADLTITVPDLISSGSPLVLNQYVYANQTQNISVNLDNYSVIPLDNTVPQMLDIDITADMPGSGTNYVIIESTDSIKVQADLTNLTFSSVTGVFEGIDANFDNIQEDVDIPTGFDDVQLQVAILNLEIDNNVDLPGQLDIQIIGDHGHYINLNGYIAPAGDSITTTLITVSDSANFLSPIPSLITVSGTVTFGDGIYQSTLFEDDYIFARVSVTAPLHMVIPESQIETDIESEEIDQDDIDVITDHLIEADFIYNVISHLPIGARIEFYFGTDSATIFSDYELKLPKDDQDTIFVAMAPVDEFGIVTDTVSTGFRSIALDSNDVKILEHETLYLVQRLFLEDSNGQAVKLTENDFLTMIGRIEVEYRFDGDF